MFYSSDLSRSLVGSIGSLFLGATFLIAAVGPSMTGLVA